MLWCPEGKHRCPKVCMWTSAPIVAPAPRLRSVEEEVLLCVDRSLVHLMSRFDAVAARVREAVGQRCP